MQDRDELLMRLAKDALRTPVAQRETFLRMACHHDQALYDEVSKIVEGEERMGNFICKPLISYLKLEELDHPFKPSQMISNRFEIIREVGDGGMGVVYETFDHLRQERIAIKCAKLGYERLPPQLNGALKVRHPNICLVNEIHTVTTDSGRLDFLTMELLDGETLLHRLSRGPLPPDDALNIARQLCAGLAEAHRSGILHRDLKPANIILSTRRNNEIRPVITDFGLAIDESGNTDLLGGTPSYMAPELIRNEKTSAASDVYALGVILYEMVTGRKPFAGSGNDDDAPDLIAPSKLVKNLSPRWDRAILPCLQSIPEDRWSAQQVLAALEHERLYRRLAVAFAPSFESFRLWFRSRLSRGRKRS
jgi:serine/threonine protein kinase